jgi:hypothetical protein
MYDTMVSDCTDFEDGMDTRTFRIFLVAVKDRSCDAPCAIKAIIHKVETPSCVNVQGHITDTIILRLKATHFTQM